MQFFIKCKEFIIGKPLDVLNPKIKDNIALIAIIAWIGLGADGLSSSSYGPAEAFLALGSHHYIAIYLAFATAITVFIISLSYNQVIELFPNGGGGYQVATHLLGDKIGAISGSALIVDYILTIAVSVASGIDALFSLIPPYLSYYKVGFEIVTILILMILNLRGMKESILVLIPLFLGFIITHIIIITLGIFTHKHGLEHILPNAQHETSLMVSGVGWITYFAIFLKAYSLGGGTYTGLEAVSNNVNLLSEPRIRTGKITMLYMAISLSLTAGGIIIIYLLWNIEPQFGKTLNAIVFDKIINHLGFSHHWLTIILFFEAALLFVGANTGFLGCPTVMANMAEDKWLPRQFRELSNRLVTQNGVLICGIISIIILVWAQGKVSTLVVLYSINVFVTFSLSLLGLTIYWYKTKNTNPKWWRKIIMSSIGLIVCCAILVITIIEKFLSGGWLTILITTVIISFCFLVRKHYKDVGLKLAKADKIFESQINNDGSFHNPLLSITNPADKTAVFFVTKHYGVGLHTLLWVQRLFPNVFKNFIFITTGTIDSGNFANNEIFKHNYKKDLQKIITNYRIFCTSHNLASDGYYSQGVDEINELIRLAQKIEEKFSDCIFFGSKLVFVDESLWSRLLHNQTLNNLQRRLHLRGIQMVILPMKME